MEIGLNRQQQTCSQSSAAMALYSSPILLYLSCGWCAEGESPTCPPALAWKERVTKCGAFFFRLQPFTLSCAAWSALLDPLCLFPATAHAASPRPVKPLFTRRYHCPSGPFKMGPSSASNILSSPPRDTEEQHHEHLFLTIE